MDSVNLTIRIDRQLKSEFEALAADVRIPVSVLLRSFMAREVKNWRRRCDLQAAEHASAVREAQAKGEKFSRVQRGQAFDLMKQGLAVPPIEAPLVMEGGQPLPAMTRAQRRQIDRSARKASK